MLKFLQSLLGGSKHEKDVKLMRPIIDEINSIFSGLSSLTDEQLRGKTQEFKDRVEASVESLRAEVEAIRERLRTDSSIEHAERSDLYARITANEREQFETIQATLDNILPEAFAVVKEACRRLVGLRYNVVGNEHVWDMIPYDVQLIGGIVLHQGKIAEMSTGEGKTLVSTLPLYLNALAGRGVHLVTVNDYLARRDSEWMAPLLGSLFSRASNPVTATTRPRFTPRPRPQRHASHVPRLGPARAMSRPSARAGTGYLTSLGSGRHGLMSNLLLRGATASPPCSPMGPALARRIPPGSGAYHRPTPFRDRSRPGAMLGPCRLGLP